MDNHQIQQLGFTIQFSLYMVYNKLISSKDYLYKYWTHLHDYQCIQNAVYQTNLPYGVCYVNETNFFSGTHIFFNHLDKHLASMAEQNRTWESSGICHNIYPRGSFPSGKLHYNWIDWSITWNFSYIFHNIIDIIGQLKKRMK